MSLIEIFSIIIIHFIADFIMQDEKWALGKSKNWDALLMHTITYTSVWLVIALIIDVYTNQTTNDWYFDTLDVQLFLLITFVCHTITDYFTSRIVSKKFAEGKYGSAIPNFGAFTLIGGDQVLHYIQLFATYYYLIKI